MPSHRLPREATPNPWSQLLAERRAAGAPLVDLTEANPTRVGLSGAGQAAFAALAAAAVARYEPDPRGAAAAREAVAGYYRERGSEVAPGDLLLTSGTSEAYAHLFRLLADPGEAFLVPAPSYPLFEPLAALEGVNLRRYRLVWDGGWRLDRGSLERAMRGDVRGMIVVQPNHPTGSCLAADELAATEELLERRGAALISDEVFGDFPWATDGGSLPTLLGPRRVPTFVLSGLSKVCGLPQMKLGWIVLAGPDPARAEARRGLEWIADLFLSVGGPVQAALPGLLAGRHAWQVAVRERLAMNLACLREAVARQPWLASLVGVGGWVAVLRVPGARNDEDWALELLRRDIVVHPGHFYDFDDEPHLVVSLIVRPEEFARGLARIAELAGDRPA